MYNPDYYKIPPQQGWQCPLCHMVWAPSVVSCACGKKEMTTNTIPAEDGWSLKVSHDTKINYPEVELINSIAAIEDKTTSTNKADCEHCDCSVYTMLTTNPPKRGDIQCAVTGKINPTKNDCPGPIKSV